MNLREKILEKCDKKIEIMQRADCPQWVKERVIKERQTGKEVLEIICGIQGITLDTAIQILEQSKEIIKEVAMTQII